MLERYGVSFGMIQLEQEAPRSEASRFICLINDPATETRSFLSPPVEHHFIGIISPFQPPLVTEIPLIAPENPVFP